ncbi:hypothetical protein E5K00_08130 [Hymenobacter aquaticus]|uniref:Lysoplasmalogenase n=1 Tax=Hymenobacter aquaticus TaxID=1867101 RepID=A0A4Z0Q8W2_9BACT|nr:hypothetical protein [Hymenobacter aquaticus]TGE25152.1 hypothetical protein E5K00_08130 [Hymenobacter aquaticus]
MPFTLQQLLMRLTLVPVLVAGIMGVVRFRHLPPSLRYLARLEWFVLPIEILGLVLLTLHRNNLFLMPIYMVGETFLLGLVYRHALQSRPFARLVPWVVGGFTLYALADTLWAENLTRFRPGQQVLQAVLVLGFVGLYFRKLLNELRVLHPTREPMFWVSTGLFIYFLGYLQIALFSNYLLQYSQQLNHNIWAVHSLLYLVLHGCFSYALWLRPRK